MRDRTDMTPEQKGREEYAAIMTNMVFVLTDVLEQAMIECEQANRDARYTLAHEAKRNYNRAMDGLKKFRSETRHLSLAEQESFGDDADMAYDLLMVALSRTGTKVDMMIRFIEYMASFPDRVGMDKWRKYGGETYKSIIGYGDKQ